MEQTHKTKRVDIRKQNKLSLQKSFNICLKGISYRLFRSALTLSVVVMAVAFFMALLAENSYIQSIAKGVNREMEELREAVTLLNALYYPPQAYAHSEKLALIWHMSDEQQKENALKEYVAVTKMPRSFIDKVAGNCLKEQLIYAFFDDMGPGDRIGLIGKAQGNDIFKYIREHKDKFFEVLSDKPHLKLPFEKEEVIRFAENYSSHEADLTEIAMKWETALGVFMAKSKELTRVGEEGIEEWICNADANQLSEWGGVIRETGFDVDDKKLSRVQEYYRFNRQRIAIESLLSTPDKKLKWREVFLDDISLSEKMGDLGNKKVAEILDNKYTVDQLKQISKKIRNERKLASVEKTVNAKMGTSNVRSRFTSQGILSGKRLFLLGISFVVCMVGIANAMLMSITERFKEIATMKCLGATDGFILTQFLMEAGIQGVAGGSIGMLIGLILAFVKNSVFFGGYVFAYFPWLGLLLSCIVSVAAGMLLAMVASVYPSWTASRMAPMEAMRVE